MRQAIAERQQAEYEEVQALALTALGPGWTPWMKLSLIDSDRGQGRGSPAVATAFKVYCGEARLTENSVYLRRMPDGQVLQADRYEPLFGDLLHEPHPTRRLEVKGQLVAAPRWTVCWSALERYQPRTAEQLAALRQTRQRKAAAREERKFAEENPLLYWAEQANREEDRQR
jgi:hypothetical protein